MDQTHDQRLTDGWGVWFARYPERLPTLTSDWPRSSIVRDADVVQAYRLDWDHCQLCGAEFGRWGVRCECHHIIGGAGRSDEATNLLMLDDGCHDESWSVMLPVALWAKWRTDKRRLNWRRLAILLGHHLPEPEPSRRYEKLYAKNRRSQCRR